MHTRTHTHMHMHTTKLTLSALSQALPALYRLLLVLSHRQALLVELGSQPLQIELCRSTSKERQPSSAS
jgi:hypothetical protein